MEELVEPSKKKQFNLEEDEASVSADQIQASGTSVVQAPQHVSMNSRLHL
jgi:hypothetical protein